MSFSELRYISEYILFEIYYMPQLIPFFFVNQVIFAFILFIFLTYIFTNYILPRFVRLFITRIFINKL
jgi:F-type H+-transporting ATPase subunit 8